MSRYYGFLNESFDKMYLQETTSNISAELDAAYEGWYYTIVGAGGNLEDWKKGIQDLLTKENIGTITKWIDFKGKDMNDKYGLTGDNQYPNDLTFLAFAIDGLDVGKLAMFKLRMGDRWFTDIVDNDRRREGYDDDASDLDESLNKHKLTPEEQIDNKNIRSAYNKINYRVNSKLNPEEKEVLNKYNISLIKPNGYIQIQDNDDEQVFDMPFSIYGDDDFDFISYMRKYKNNKNDSYNNFKRHEATRGHKKRPKDSDYSDTLSYYHPNMHYASYGRLNNVSDFTKESKIKPYYNSYYNYSRNPRIKELYHQANELGQNHHDMIDALKDKKVSLRQRAETEKIKRDSIRRYNDRINEYNADYRKATDTINSILKRK